MAQETQKSEAEQLIENERIESKARQAKNEKAGRVFAYALSFSLVATGVAALGSVYVALTKDN